MWLMIKTPPFKIFLNLGFEADNWSQCGLLIISSNFKLDFGQFLDFPGGSDSKVSTYNVGDPGSIPWFGKISWRRKWQPSPVFLSGKSCGWRSLVGYRLWCCKESDTTERLHSHFGQFQYYFGDSSLF